MSNYLADLVARSFTPAEAILPRLPSRFEPITDGAPADAIPAADMTIIERTEADERPAAYPGSQAARDARIDVPASPQGQPHREAEADAQAQPWREQRVPPTEAQITTASAATALEGGRGEAADVRDERPASPPTRAPIRVSVAMRDHLPGSERQQARELPGPRQVARPQPGAIHADIEPEAERAESHDEPVSQSVPKPELIQVTIGRIEVRAIAPPAIPAKAAATPANKLSLADYLRGDSRGRAGGGR